MKFQLKLLLALNLIFTIIFLLHIFGIGHKLLYPDNPSVRIYNRNLSEVDFPLSFKLCLFEQRNTSDRYLNIGYSNVYWFFEGKSKNGEVFGWNGHSNYNQTIGSVQGKNKHISFIFRTLCHTLKSTALLQRFSRGCLLTGGTLLSPLRYFHLILNNLEQITLTSTGL